MAYLNGEPRVDTREIDLSQVILSSSSNVGVVVGRAERGPVNKKVFVSDDLVYTSTFGSTNSDKYGFMASTSLTFLEGSNQLYVTRIVADDAAFSGFYINAAAESDVVDEAILTIEADTKYPAQKVLAHSPTIFSSLVLKVDSDTVATFDINGKLVMDSTATSNITGRYSYATNTVVIESTTYPAATAITATYKYLDSSNPTVTPFTASEMTTEDYTEQMSTNKPDAIMAIYSDNQGAWGNNLKVSIGNIDTRNSTFDITVYETVNNIDLEKGVYRVSRKEQLDGTGSQLFVEDVINDSSLWIRVKNLGNDDSLLPPVVTKQKLAGAVDGSAPTQSQLSKGWSLYEDWESIDVDIFMDCGQVSETDNTVQQAMRSVAESRQDCLALFSVPFSEMAMTPITKCTDWRQNLQGIDSSYTAVYTSWIKARDTFRNKIVNIPPVGYVGSVMAKLPDTYIAPAGLDQGVITSSIYPPVGVSQEYSPGERNALYNAGVNVIKPYPSAGYVVWGQKTQQTMASALDRINVRRSINTIKRAIRKAYAYKLFKNNDIWTRSSLYNAVTEYMNTRRAAFYDFKVICDESNNTPEVIDRNHIVLTLMIKPVKAAEYGIFNIVITSTGVEFSSVEGSITV